jgi:hypothetical protein
VSSDPGIIFDNALDPGSDKFVLPYSAAAKPKGDIPNGIDNCGDKSFLGNLKLE